MTEFRVTIRLGNAAMQSGADIADALRAIADTIGDNYDPMSASHAASVFDANGNRVGQWKVTDDD